MTQEIAIVPEVSNDLTVVRSPEVVLEEAGRAAKALVHVISKKAKPVMFNGHQYLEYGDWQTMGKFYGLLCQTSKPREVTIGGTMGAEAEADIVDVRTGQIVGHATAWCLRDEPNWRSKPWHQLGSMAQTRAGAKAFRNLLSWVVELAGYKTTPAEELDVAVPEAPPIMTSEVQSLADRAVKVFGAPEKKWDHPAASPGVRYISAPQAKRFYAIAKGAGATDEKIKEFLIAEIGEGHTKMIPLDRYEELCKKYQSGS